MKFNIWLVVTLALMPVTALFAGVTISAGFSAHAGWWVLAAIGVAVAFSGYRAGRGTG